MYMYIYFSYKNTPYIDIGRVAVYSTLFIDRLIDS